MRPSERKARASTSAFDSRFAPEPQNGRPSQVPSTARRSRRENSLSPVIPSSHMLTATITLMDSTIPVGMAAQVNALSSVLKSGDVLGAKYTYSDESIGLTRHAWTYEVPAVAIEFPGEVPR